MDIALVDGIPAKVVADCSFNALLMCDWSVPFVSLKHLHTSTPMTPRPTSF